MASNYAFLKYGKPMAAAAPLLLALNFLPVPAHACTGNDNDPPHCINNNGQPIQNFGSFIIQNLIIVPGSTTVGEEGQFVIPHGFDSSFNNTVQFGGGSSGAGIDSFPTYTPDLEATGEGQSFASRLAGTVQYYVVTPDFSGGNIFFGPNSPDEDDLDIQFADVDDLFIFDENGELPNSFRQFLVPGGPDEDDADNATFDCSQVSIETCSFELGEFHLAVNSLLPPENRLDILSALPIDDDTETPLGTRDFYQVQIDNLPGNDTPDDRLRGNDVTEDDFQDPFFDDDGDSVLDQFGLDQGAPLADALVNELRIRFPRRPEPEPEDTPVTQEATTRNGEIIPDSQTDGSGNGGQASNEDAGRSFLDRQVASVRKLRERVANETNPERKAELERELADKENQIRQFGSAAIRAALQLEDSQSAPVPGRGG